MRRTLLTLPAAAILLAACTDPPLTTEPIEPVAALAVATAACTKSWANGNGGAWEDPGNWFPAGVPAVTDVACIDAPGTYEVTLDSTFEVASLVVGGRGVVTLHIDDPATAQDGARLTVDDTLHVVTGSTLVFEGDDTSLTVRGALINDGTVRVVEECGCALATIFTFAGPGSPLLHNRGLLAFDGNAVIWIDGGTFINDGDITSDFLGPSIYMKPQTNPLRDVGFEMRGGHISGRYPLEVFATQSIPAGLGESTFEWTGGTFDRSIVAPGRSALRIGGFDITLGAGALSSTLDVLTYPSDDTTRIHGDVGEDVELQILSYYDRHAVAFEGAAGRTTNRGAVHFARMWAIADPLTVSFGTFVNEGLLTVTQVDHVGLEGDSLVNAGTFVTDTDVRLPARTTVLRNDGTVLARSKPLRMGSLTTFHAAAGSVMTGRLLLEGATLEGDGEVGTVVAIDGTIRPGAPIGTLTAANVALDARSALDIEVAGTDPGTHDLLAVGGEVVYGGATLAVTEIAPFTGGLCGQVVPIVTDSATVPRGGFGKVVGLQPGLTRSWRMDNPANALQLAGYNPLVAMGVQPDSVTVTEGTPGTTYAICLGTAPPTADVVVTTARRGTQIEVFPRTLTFTTANWMLPQLVTVVAVNDAVVEGPHGDGVDHMIASADPYYASAFLRWVDVGIVDNDQSVAASGIVRREGR
jgi:hypothetical protein